MKKNKFDKTYIMRVILFVIIIIAIYFSIDKAYEPFDSVRKIRNTVENYELIAAEKTKNGTMLYSAGKVNGGSDNMYFVDGVKKSFIGYKWLGGSGHINRDMKESKDFIFSMQLINENQRIDPVLFGILLDTKVSKITVTTIDEVLESVIYDGKEKSEKFYFIPFTNSISDAPFFLFTITYEEGKMQDYIITGDKVSELQAGKALYCYEDDFR